MHTQTHEAYVHAVARIAAQRLDTVERERINAIKLVYGAGQSGLRGVTYFDSWKNGHPTANPFVEVCAFGQESHIQLAGTTIHELGHVLAGWQAAHGGEWKGACERLGLRRCKAAGTLYSMAMFAPDIRFAIAALPVPDEGAPCRNLSAPGGFPAGFVLKPCGAGIGTKGGKSRGKGSGSRLRLWECGCEPPVKVRIGRDVFDATCNCCNLIFERKSV